MASSIDKIIVKLGDSLHEIERSAWQKQKLKEKITGDARVLVKRGALVADIPSDVPFGTFCILVNLAAISEKK